MTASRRSRQRRDKRAPIPDFDDTEPRHLAGFFFGGRYERRDRS